MPNLRGWFPNKTPDLHDITYISQRHVKYDMSELTKAIKKSLAENNTRIETYLLLKTTFDKKKVANKIVEFPEPSDFKQHKTFIALNLAYYLLYCILSFNRFVLPIFYFLFMSSILLLLLRNRSLFARFIYQGFTYFMFMFFGYLLYPELITIEMKWIFSVASILGIYFNIKLLNLMYPNFPIQWDDDFKEIYLVHDIHQKRKNLVRIKDQ